MITDAELAEMKARCEAASPGPWYRTNHLVTSEKYFIAGMRRRPLDACVMDAEFISKSRQDIPLLIDDVIEAKSQLMQAKIRCDELENQLSRMLSAGESLWRAVKYDEGNGVDELVEWERAASLKTVNEANK